jgi:hypothetical protein
LRVREGNVPEPSRRYDSKSVVGIQNDTKTLKSTVLDELLPERDYVGNKCDVYVSMVVASEGDLRSG